MQPSFSLYPDYQTMMLARDWLLVFLFTLVLSILFGTDAEPIPEMYRNYFRWLETEDEYFPYWSYPEQGRWEIYGLGLPDSILEKVYHKNAEKIFAQFRGGRL